MNLLIDTHVLLWMMFEPEKLSKKVKQILENTKNIVNVSYLSLWEIAVKVKIGKLEIKMAFEDIVENIENQGIIFLPIEKKHISETINLELHHRDPFDRMLIAQSKVENLTMITKDNNFSKYDINIIW